MPLHDMTPQDLPVIGRAISAGVKQDQAEDLLRKHDPSTRVVPPPMKMSATLMSLNELRF